MARILGIETSSGLCSAAVLVDGDLYEDTRKMERLHNEYVLELIDRVMQRAGIAPALLDGVAFGCGPGSFTGVRIAASVAQGIAFGGNACVLPVASTLALADAAGVAESDAVSGVIPIIRSRRDAYYFASFEALDGRLVPNREVRLFDAVPDWQELDDPAWHLAGPLPTWLGDLVPPDRCHPDAATDGTTVAHLGLAAFQRGEGQPPEFGLPTYVEGDSPWRASR